MVVFADSFDACGEKKVLDVLSASFASVYTTVEELGAGDADQRVVLQAWSLFEQLEANAVPHRATDVLLRLLSLALTFAATFLAVATTVTLRSYLTLKRSQRICNCKSIFRNDLFSGKFTVAFAASGLTDP